MTKSRETEPINPDDRWMDQLVDDELDESDRRRLLAGLDRQPDGWRKCATAFLEAQAWRRAFSGLSSDVNAPSCAVSQTSGAVSVGSRVKGFGACASVEPSHLPWYAMAACVLVALVVGAGAQHTFSRYQSKLASPMVEAERIGDRRSTDDRITPWKGISGQVGGPGTKGATPVGPVKEQEEMVDVATAPAQLLEALRRRGHRIHRQRGIVPFRFEDGRRGFVPVEDLYVVPANLRTY